MKPAYKRVLLKLSGEAFMGSQKFGIDPNAFQKIAAAIKEVSAMGVQIGVVVGGGNIFRGSQAKALGFSRTPADHVGMLATTINGIILQQSLSSLGCESRVMNAVECDSVIEAFDWNTTLDYLREGKVVVFSGGTGNPYFTTDTAAALRACEIDAEILLKATKVDGIYDKDPVRYSTAKKFPTLSYAEVLSKKLDVMDATAITLCRDNQIPIHVFNLFKTGALLNAICNKKGGSIVKGE